jgi:hypothetical protein
MKSQSQYMQQALVEATRFDIEEGYFSEALLEKIGSESLGPAVTIRVDV